ncbi:MAG: hypothetical protein JSS82_11075 [Bacteroidetes bacterium]|nr:hypothetical protein [Bacteroidota bacterium]
MRQILIAACACLASHACMGQKIQWESGEDLAFLKGQKELAVEYDYSAITVKGEREADYLKMQREELNKDEKGEGDAFVDEWTRARTSKYQPHFEKEFNKRIEDSALQVKPGSGTAKYTLIIITNDMALGKGSAFGKKPAEVDFTLRFVESANRDKVLAQGKLEDVKGEVKAPKGSGFIPGAGGVMSMTAHVMNKEYSNRIAESYEKTGLALAKYISKKL